MPYAIEIPRWAHRLAMSPIRPAASRKSVRSSLRIRTGCTGSFSKSSNVPMACQYMRSMRPPGVSGPVCVSRSLSSCVITPLTPRRRGHRVQSACAGAIISRLALACDEERWHIHSTVARATMDGQSRKRGSESGMADKIGFIGLGTMGRPFATNIVRAGFDLTVYDVQPQPVNELVKLGARAARSAREVADLVDIVDIAVPHEAEVDAVLQGPDGLLAGAHPGLIAAIHSSIHPLHMMRVAEEARAHGVEVLDAQMSGGAGGVTSQTLCLMVVGDPAVLERCRPVLETTAGNIFLLGKVGMGAVTKIAQ